MQTTTSPLAQASPMLMLHLGLGAFHRAHQAFYLHRLMESGCQDWTLAGGNLRPDMADTLEALSRQNGEYTLEIVSPDGERRYERIRSLRRVIPWQDSPAALIEAGAQPQTRIVSFTVTEAGYYLDDQNRLDVRHPDIAADLAGAACGTIYGAVCAILSARKARDSGALTLLSCDNLRSNGERFHAGLLEFLERRGDAALLHWARSHISCPSSMVDRITPRPGAEVRRRVLEATGVDDAAAVMCESFAQWVIEDRFCNGRPAWEAVGVRMVDSVQAFEEAKIRILNASHSGLAWGGALSGHRYIHQSVADPQLLAWVRDYVTADVIPCLQPSPLDLAGYRDTVLERFGNGNLQDSCERVTADSFAKIPAFFGATLRERLARGAPIDATAQLLALYFAFLDRQRQGGIGFSYHDQAMDAAWVESVFAAPAPLQRFCSSPRLWGELAGHPRLQQSITEAGERLAPFLKDRAASAAEGARHVEY